MHNRTNEGDRIAHGRQELLGFERYRPSLALEEEIPGAVIFTEAANGVRKVKHQQILGVMR